MDIRDLIIHEWAPERTIAPMYDKDGNISGYLIAFEFADGLQAEAVLEAVAKAAQSCR
jgi:hypothetical protein